MSRENAELGEILIDNKLENENRQLKERQQTETFTKLLKTKNEPKRMSVMRVIY